MEEHDSKSNSHDNSPEEKKKRAFIPSTLFSTNKQVVEERVIANSRAASGNTTMTDFEERVRAKSNALKPTPRSDSRLGVGDSSSESKSGVSMDDFQQRILKKSFSTDSNDSARSAANSLQASSILEQRIMEKTKSNNATTAGSSSRSSTSSQSSHSVYWKRPSQTISPKRPGLAPPPVQVEAPTHPLRVNTLTID